MEADQLKQILDDHLLWLESKGGKRTNLRGSDLSGANLIGSNLTGAYLTDTNLSGANLIGSNLTGAYLTGSDLTGVNWDFASFPLSCGGAHFKCDAELYWKLQDHALTLECDDPQVKAHQEYTLKHGTRSKRAKDLGL